MTKSQTDPSRHLGCCNRIPAHDLLSMDFCRRTKRYCRPSEECRVPIRVSTKKKHIDVEIPPREWLLERLQLRGGIAPEYGIAMLNRIEALEGACSRLLEAMEVSGIDTSSPHDNIDEVREVLKG